MKVKLMPWHKFYWAAICPTPTHCPYPGCQRIHNIFFGKQGDEAASTMRESQTGWYWLPRYSNGALESGQTAPGSPQMIIRIKKFNKIWVWYCKYQNYSILLHFSRHIRLDGLAVGIMVQPNSPDMSQKCTQIVWLGLQTGANEDGNWE